MFMKFINDNKIMILLTLNLLVLVSCRPYYMFKEPPHWWENRLETIGIVYEIKNQPETVIRYQFYVDGEKYTRGYVFLNESIKWVVEGSKFMIAYNPKNPNENHILLHEPRFSENDEVGFTDAEIQGINGKGLIVVYKVPFFGNFELLELGISYNVAGNLYKNVTCYVLNDKSYNIEEIKRIRNFKVMYWVNNPWRSIILLDEPVNE